jgi:hypothetical protein
MTRRRHKVRPNSTFTPATKTFGWRGHPICPSGVGPATSAPADVAERQQGRFALAQRPGLMVPGPLGAEVHLDACRCQPASAYL